MKSNSAKQPRITRSFIVYLSRTLALATLGAMGLTATHAATSWTAVSNGGDGLNWLDGSNWDTFNVPIAVEDLTFALGESMGPVFLNGNQTAQSLTFNDDYTLGAPGVTDTLTNTSGNVSVNVGKFVTMNQRVGGASGINLNGGGSLYLTNVNSPFSGNILVDNGSTLVHRGEGPTNQYNGAGSAQEVGRGDELTLGFTTATRNITLQNGGVFKIINAGNNSEGNYKNIVIGVGGGTINVSAGHLLHSLDDIGQIGVTTNTFTKAGKGRLGISGTMANGTGTAPNFTGGNPLGGIVNVNGGILGLDTSVNTTTGANTYVRFSGIAATGSTLNINAGGTIMINNGTAGTLDTPIINLNNGGIFGINGQDHAIGFATATVGVNTALNINGTSTLLTRDLFGPQVQRFPRLRAELNGTGTLQLLGNTNAGGTPRLVIERSASTSNFSGTFKLMENTSLEANPRFNASAAGGTGTADVDTGKVIAGGDIEFAGWGSTLDVRQSDGLAAVTANVKDYTNNEITVTTTQNGALNFIAPGRATAAFGAGHLFNFGTLTMGNHRIAIAGNNSYQTGFADTAVINGNAVIEMRSDGSHLVFNNAAAINEDAAGRSITFLKTGVATTAARDVISGGAISVSNVNIPTGTLQLRGASGAITTGFGGAAPTITLNGTGLPGNGSTLPTAGLLHLDNNTGHVVGATTVFAAANNANRIDDTAILNMRGNSALRLTSLNNAQSTETIGTTNVFGHGLIDVVKTGTATAPVALTLTNLTLGTNATANFTGTALGTGGVNTSRIVIGGAATGALSSQYHVANEWAKYDATVDNGFAIGVTPFVAADYTIASAENTWVAGQQIKQNTAALPTLTGDRVGDRFNFQTITTANLALNTAGFKLTAEQGGILVAGLAIGFKDGATAAVPSGTSGITAGTTAAAASLFVQANQTTEFHLPIIDNTGGGSVTFVKSGTGQVILSHQDRAVGAAQVGAPFTTSTWSSTNTGGWVINDSVINVHRGQYLGATPTTVTLNGGQLEINEPVSNANADTILPGWGHNIVINGNAQVSSDDNGEATDAGTGDRTLARLGSLTINNNAIFSSGAFSDSDIAYMGGVTINGKGTINIGVARSGTNVATIFRGNLAGAADGIDVLGLGGGGSTLIFGGSAGDTVANTYTGAVTLYSGVLRGNKANGVTAFTDGAAAEDIVINGGTFAWGPGQHGDLVTTNNVNLTNNGVGNGLMPTSPVATKLAGQNQIADTATVTLLTGTLGEGDRINNEIFGGLIQKNGTFNVGLGSIEVGTATISGGAFNIDRSGAFKAGTLTLLQGAPDLNITTGLPVPGASTVLEVGAGGLSMSGQNIQLGTGSSGNVQGSGAVLKLGGDITHTGTDLIGGSYGRKGIFVNMGSFRQLGGSNIDLLGGTRTVTIDGDSIFTITVPFTNGGITKAGNGALVLEPYMASSFTGPVTVNAGVLQAKGDGAFGTSAGGVTINSGATVKLDSGWTYGDDFVVSGVGSLIAGDTNVLEGGALIAENSTSKITGAFAISGGATLAGATVTDPSVAPGAGGAAFRIGRLFINSAAGITGTGNLTLAGNGDGLILNGVNTNGGVTKVGGGVWTLAGAGTYTGVTAVNAGVLRITNGAALGTTAGNTIVSSGTLEISGGITSAEPLNLGGAGVGIQSGAVVNASGANTLSGNIALGLAGATLRSDAGSLTIGGNIAGSTGLTLSGAGNGTTSGTIATGAGSGATALTKNGTGTWTIANTASLNGATAVNGGTLAISASGSVLDAISPISFNGGKLVNTGAAQAVFSTNLNAGNAGIAGGAGVSLGAITRALGSTASFGGTVTTTNSNTNGILGGYATVGSDWATVSGGSIVALASYTPFATATGTDNATLGTSATLLAASTVNSLKVTGGQGIAAGANNIIANSGGILSNTAYAGITGTGTLSGATSGDELVFNTASGTLDVSAPLIGAGAGSLTKAGNGKLVLRGASAFTGSVNINGGTLAIVGPGGVTHPTTLGALGARNINVNGGTFELVGGDFDPGAGGLQFAIGSAGGTLRSSLGATFTVNDANQLSGSGDLTLTGGGRYAFNASVNYSNFTGGVTVDGGILTVANGANTSTAVFGGRAEQTITLKTGSAIINNQFFGLGGNGLANNIVAETGTEFFSLGGNRVYGGDIKLGGTHTIALLERDNHAQERQLYFNGKVSGTGVTLNVHGVNNGQPFYLTSGANDLTGNINLKPNAIMEVRSPGSLGQTAGDVTVNMEANSRLLLRHWQNADYKANVVTSGNVELNSDRLTGYAGGGQQFMSINNLTVTGDSPILTVQGGNGYYTRVAGTAALNGTINNVLQINSSDTILENGITFGTPSSTLQKRGAFSLLQRGPSNHAGEMILHQSLYILQDGGTLPSVGAIKLRGGELRLDNSAVANADRLNNAAPISLGGGALRITGAETLGTVTAASGTTVIVNNQTSDTVASALTLTGFTRQTGSVVQFNSPDFGPNAVGATTFGQSRVSSRIIIPGQADTTQTIPGLVGNNGVDFIQYDGTTTDSGAVLGVRDMRNPGSGAAFATNYSDNTAETGWNDNIIFRHTNPTDATVVTTTLTANRSVDAMKIESGGTNRDYVVAMGAFNLRIEGGGILDVGNGTHDLNINGTTGVLTAGPATPGVGTAELILGGTTGGSAFNVNAIIGNNSTQAVALVKTGTNTISLNAASANTYTGGTYVNGGILNVIPTNALGAASNPVYLAGSTLQFNATSATSGIALGGFGQAVNVLANSTIIVDNGALAGTNNSIAMGALNINGPYTLSMRAFDAMDMSFTGAAFAGTPVLDLAQAASGSGNASVFSINGAITGSGFNVGSSGATDNTAGTLQIGGGAADTVANTYSGKLTMLLGISSVGSFSEDMLVLLNKAAGTTAVTGDIEINGGLLRNMASNQIADTSNMVINQGQYHLNSTSETIASLVMNGGNVLTAPTTGVLAAGTFTITGGLTVNGTDDLVGATGTGFTIGNNSTTTVGGLLNIGAFGRVHLAEGATAAVLNINGGLQLTGSSLTQNNGAGANIVRLSSDVVTNASSNPARIGASTDSDTFLELNGTRTFTSADGSAGLDLVLSTVIRDSTAPVAVGHLVKNGTGTMQIEGGGSANTYTGTTAVNEGSVVLFKTAGVNAIPAGALTIGDGTGGAKADKVIVRSSNQIADANNVTVASSGVLDLQSFGASETVASVSGDGAVDLGSGSVFTVNGSTTETFSGVISGSGTLTRSGSGTTILSGSMNDVLASTVSGTAKLLVNGVLGGDVLVQTGGTLGGSGTTSGNIVVQSGGFLAPGNSPGLINTGSLNLQDGSTLSIQIEGSTLGSGYDSVNVTGAVSLLQTTGSILSLSGSYVPLPADYFALIINDGADAVSGTFAGYAEGGSVGFFNGVELFITYAGNVDAGSTSNDVLLTVPEPGSATLLIGGLAMLLGRRRRKQA